MVPLLICVGMAVDISRQYRTYDNIQLALDAAALYAVQHIGEYSLDDLEDKAEEVFDANIGDTIDFSTSEFSAEITDTGEIRVKASGVLASMFAKVGGYPRLDVTVATQAVARSTKGIEMVIAFDTTASMGFDNTWDAATSTLRTILEDLSVYSGDNDFNVSLVPFSDRVQVGTDKSAWLSGSAPGGWNGCVEAREEDQDGFEWALDDDTPTTMPFDASIYGVTGGLANAGWGGPTCPSVALTGPTSDVSEIITAAENLTKAGTGRFDVAMAWSWRLMSPQWQNLWGVTDYPAISSDDSRKIAIYVTDGRTEAYTYELTQERSWGFNQGSESGFEHMVHVCNQMKDDGIEIYMIRVNGNHHAESYMQQCATDADHYQVVHNNNDLAVVFTDIAIGVKSEMHLSR